MVGWDVRRKSTALAVGLAVSCLLGGSLVAPCSGEPANQQTAAPQPAAPAPAADFAPEIQPADVGREMFFGARPTALDEYRLGPEDVIEVHAFELDPLNVTVRVAGDGSIELPLVGKIAVKDLTAPEIAAKIMEKLRGGDIENPQVSVLVKEFNSRRVYVLGAVGKADNYAMPGQRTLLQMLAAAGGLDPKVGKVLYVFRDAPDGRNARLTVPIHELQVGDLRYNIWLLPGDIVNVPAKEVVKVSVLGAVKSPGIYELPIEDGPSLLKAIAMSGGLTTGASQKDMSLVRRDSTGRETVTKIDMKAILAGKKSDVSLLEGDVILVKESFW